VQEPENITPTRLVDELYRVIEERRSTAAADSYVASLFARGSDRILQKVGEELVEVLLAAKNRNRQEIVSELADLVFHLLVMMADQEITPDEVRAELGRRFGRSGLAEKAARRPPETPDCERKKKA